MHKDINLFRLLDKVTLHKYMKLHSIIKQILNKTKEFIKFIFL